MDGRDLFDPTEAELGAPVRIRTPPVAVVTGITGGADSRSNNDTETEMKDFALVENGEENDRAHGIMTTVRMEHSYV